MRCRHTTNRPRRRVPPFACIARKHAGARVSTPARACTHHTALSCHLLSRIDAVASNYAVSQPGITAAGIPATLPLSLASSSQAHYGSMRTHI